MAKYAIVPFDNFRSSEELEMIKYKINLFKKKLLNEIPFEEQLCDRCFSLQIEKDNKLQERKQKLLMGMMCTKCGKEYYDDVSYCEECSFEVRFKKYCYNCNKPTDTKFCSTCGEKILL